MSRRNAGIVAAILGVLALTVVPLSSASTAGGVRADQLAGAHADTQRLTGVQLAWTPVAAKSGWNIAGLTVTTDPGQSFAAGDTLKVTVQTSASARCELTADVASATTRVQVGKDAVAAACGTLSLSDAQAVALSITGDDLATSFTGDLGNVRGTLASFAGAVVHPDWSLRANAGTITSAGVSYVGKIAVDVTASSLTAAALDGTEALVHLYNSDTGTDFQYGGTVSLDTSAPIHAATADGKAAVTVTIDASALADRAGTARPRTSQVNRFDVVLYTPQHLGATRSNAAGAYAVALTSGTIVTAAPGATWAVDAVGLDSRLSYQYPATETNESNGSLSFCHNFTVTNTSSAPVEWTLSFDTSLQPLWGFDPTASGAFRTTWNWQTVSYDAATHLWTIGGPSWGKTLQPGQNISGGYCVDSVPVPPVDPTTFTTSFQANPNSSAWYASFDLSVSSTSHWDVPWQVTVDLADLACAAGLEGRTVTWSGSVKVIASHGTVYTLQGVPSANTRFVSATRPFTISTVASYTPLNGQYGTACAKARVAAKASPVAPSATPTDAAATTAPTDAAASPASATDPTTVPASSSETPVPTATESPLPAATTAAEPSTAATTAGQGAGA